MDTISWNLLSIYGRCFVRMSAVIEELLTFDNLIFNAFFLSSEPILSKQLIEFRLTYTEYIWP